MHYEDSTLTRGLSMVLTVEDPGLGSRYERVWHSK